MGWAIDTCTAHVNGAEVFIIPSSTAGRVVDVPRAAVSSRVSCSDSGGLLFSARSRGAFVAVAEGLEVLVVPHSAFCMAASIPAAAITSSVACG